MFFMDINKLRRIANNATPGPWGVEYHEKGANLTYCPHGVDCLNSRHDPYLAQDLTKEDAEFFFEFSPEVALKLLDEIVRLRAPKTEKNKPYVWQCPDCQSPNVECHSNCPRQGEPGDPEPIPCEEAICPDCGWGGNLPKVGTNE